MTRRLRAKPAALASRGLCGCDAERYPHNKARTERDLMRPVVSAAEIWRNVAPAKGFGINTDALTAAVDAYRAARKADGQ